MQVLCVEVVLLGCSFTLLLYIYFIQEQSINSAFGIGLSIHVGVEDSNNVRGN